MVVWEVVWGMEDTIGKSGIMIIYIEKILGVGPSTAEKLGILVTAQPKRLP
ncbi:hypothetical protein [Ferroglobus sp.]|uniref:hypothetical protein n=1 Tax=Ferroglobus sp. TaxID=2614230 RepID=UPI0025BB2C6A|nr:hypothetical protein [Ferroglobus sp.]